MKMLIAIGTIYALSSCTPAVTFSEPQPPKGKNMEQFPERYTGTWFNPLDSSQLTITRQMMVHRFMIQSTDSLHPDAEYLDTVFQLSDHHILRRFRHCLFMNRSTGESGWEVTRLEAGRNTLRIIQIQSREDIEKIREISPSEDSLPPYRFNPTRKQFRKILRNPDLGDTQIYVRKEKLK